MTKITISPTDRVFVLTGAGISAESGLPTFRASDGLWAGHRIEDVCTPEAPTHPKRVRSRHLAGVRGGGLLVAMAGGGADAYELMSTLLDSVTEIRASQPCALLLVTGPFMPESERDDLKRRARRLRVHVRTTVSDPLSYVAAADLVVSMAGYNTTMEVLRLGTPALLVPRRGPSSEQRMRARRFAAQGWLSMLDPDELSAGRLASAVLDALSSASPRPAGTGPDLGGLDRAVDHLYTSALAARGDTATSGQALAGARLTG